MKQYILDAIAKHQRVFVYFNDKFDAKEALMVSSSKPCDGNYIIVGTLVNEYCINLDQVLAVECRQI